ncbi:TIGR03668 family PPOX class F420-dependent oxidoreductase [Streptomonospora sp. S1-112]|uniref:TIGR03668 family PPOX class F420-dependent oxidoreductase n=1 Tax=Streptomonospora mangrovi TaxID=2883123 RepID=A0A9X3SEM0_9ACTN|nr:TIGR03668 family PPOX class F420-dependent oxidoreductase [Streptomonospora mangrovi]MDA0565107.1 TIGR03668 family PPOX class F420-dependent oxidoreductase [Streptomonospora mangrovi]
MRWSAQRCRAAFARARVARLATADADGRPHLAPVVFALWRAPDGGDTLATAVDHKPKRTTALRRLADIAANPRVCLLADHYTEDWDRLWWVRAEGAARITAAGPEHAEAVARLRERYAPYRTTPPAGPAVLVSVDRWTGWSAR